MDLGSAVHGILLEQDESRIVVIEAENYLKKDAQAARDLARLQRKTPLLTEDFAMAKMITEAVHRQLKGSELDGIFDDGQPELTGIWEDGGALCRIRADWAPRHEQLIVDLKTTGTSSEPNKFVRRISDGGYDIQGTFYPRGWKKLTGEDRKFVYLIVENEPPFALTMATLQPEWVEMAAQVTQIAIETWTRCLETDIWPGYPDRVCHLEIPPWRRMQLEARLIGN